MRHDNPLQNINWGRFTPELKKYGLASLGLLGLLFSFNMGGSALQIVGGLIAMGTYFAYPKEINHWLDNNQGMLTGGAFGFFYAGPIGLALGAWLGHFLHHKYLQVSEAANQVAQVVRPVVAGGNWLKENTLGRINWLKDNAVNPVMASGNWVKEKAGGLYQEAVSGISNAVSSFTNIDLEPSDDLSEEEPAPAAELAPAAAEVGLGARNEPALNLSSVLNSGRDLAAKSLAVVNNAIALKNQAVPLYNQVASKLQSVGNFIIGNGSPDEEEAEPEISTRDLIQGGKDLISKGLTFFKGWMPQAAAPEGDLLRANAPVYFASQGPGPVQEKPDDAPALRRSTRKRKRTDPFLSIM